MSYAVFALSVRVVASALVVWRAYVSWAQVAFFATGPVYVGDVLGIVRQPPPMPRWLLVVCSLVILGGIWL